MPSIWNVFIKFRWHDEKLTMASAESTLWPSEGARKLFAKLNLFRYLTNRWRQRWICRASFLPSPLLSSVSKWLFKWQNNLNPFHMFLKYYYIRWYFKGWWKPPLSTLNYLFAHGASVANYLRISPWNYVTNLKMLLRLC